MKRFFGLLALLLCVPALLSACGTGEPGAASSAASGPQLLSPDEAKAMIDAGGVTVVDVRRPDEFAQAHIEGAVNVPVETIGSEPPAALPDRGAVLLIHCRSGVRSKTAVKRLSAMGYTALYDFGGLLDWPYETVEGDEPSR